MTTHPTRLRRVRPVAVVRILLSSALFLFCSFSPPADKIVTGKVLTLDGAPLAGATVTVKGTTISGGTDNAGGFSISVPESLANPVLVVSSVGYVSKEISVSELTSLGIRLEVDIRKLNDVVVVGYGTQKRKDLTGSIASVSSAQIEQRPVSAYQDALAGTAAGIDVSPRSARPGNVAEIRIRGIGSISGDTEPLYVIDGFPSDAANASAINPADIASVDILKDASATAIYGSRGANGVIIITTKSGKSGQARIDVNLKTGFSKANRNDFYKVLNGAQYTEWYKEKAQFAGTPIPDWITNWNGQSTNWQDVIYRTAPFRDYGLSASGGTDKFTFLFSGDFLNQEDILIKAGFSKYSARMKMDYKASKRLSIGLYLAPNFTNQRLSAPEDDFSSLTGDAVLLPPIIPVYGTDGKPSDPNSYGILTNRMANPLTIAENYNVTQKNFFLLSNAYIQLEILKGLTLKSSLGANLSDNRYRYFQPEGLQAQALSPVTATDLFSERTVNWLNENTLNYKTIIHNDHSLELLAGYTVQKVDYVSQDANASGFNSNLAQTISYGTTQGANSGATGNTLISYLARVNYAYKDKYLLTATIRRDGSSRFGLNNLWGVFPSVAAGWNLDREKFMESAQHWLDHAKIRASYGSTGSNFIGDFTSKASLRSVNHSFGTTPVVGYVNNDPGNPDLSWEKSNQVDIGADIGVFNRVSVTLDYYNNITKDLLLAVNVPTSTGYSTNLENIGRMRKWGYEVTVNVNVIKEKDFGWDLGFNASHLRQRVLALGPTGAPLSQFFNVLITQIGGPLEQEHALKTTGILTQKDIDAGVPRKAVGDQAGDYKFVDVNGDGYIDAFNGQDGLLVGDNNPRWLYGINTSVRFKNFRFSALLQGQQGAKVLDFVYQIMSLHTNNTNMDRFFYDGRYISESQPGNGKTPRAGYNDVGAVSSWEVQKTDYLRIRNLNLSYTFPGNISQKVWVNNLRAFVSVENLHTFKSYEGGNPQATRYGSGRIVGDGRTLGLNSVATAPIPVVYTLGINFSF